MTEPTARERELAATVNLGSGNWTDEIARLLARYRDEIVDAVCARIAAEADAARAALEPPDMTPAEVVASITSALREVKR